VRALEVELREAAESGEILDFVELTHHLTTAKLQRGEFAAARDHLDRAETHAAGARNTRTTPRDACSCLNLRQKRKGPHLQAFPK
jgi:hypothetical protein